MKFVMLMICNGGVDIVFVMVSLMFLIFLIKKQDEIVNYVFKFNFILFVIIVIVVLEYKFQFEVFEDKVHYFMLFYVRRILMFFLQE